MKQWPIRAQLSEGGGDSGHIAQQNCQGSFLGCCASKEKQFITEKAADERITK